MGYTVGDYNGDAADKETLYIGQMSVKVHATTTTTTIAIAHVLIQQFFEISGLTICSF